MSGIKIIVVIFFVIASTTAFRDFARHMIHQKFLFNGELEKQSGCNSIIAECQARFLVLENQHDTSTTEGEAEYLSDVAVLLCGDCFDEYKDYFRCIDEDDLVEELREADCARSDGKYCSESYFDGIADGNLRVCSEDVCATTCQDLRNIRNYWGCCAASYEQYGLLTNTAEEYEKCNADLGEPCSGMSVATPTFVVIAVLTLITSTFL